MPAKYVIDTQGQIVLTVLKGVVTVSELAEERTRLCIDTAFGPEFSELIDFTSVSEVQMDYADLKSLEKIDPFFASSRRALVVGPQSSNYGAARMYQIMRNDEDRVEIFKNRSEALQWLTAARPAGE